MTSVRNLKVVKKPRDLPIPDVPINFPPLHNLHLELLEIKEKLKPGLPLIPRSKPVLQPLVNPKPEHREKTPRPSIPPKDLKTTKSEESDIDDVITHSEIVEKPKIQDKPKEKPKESDPLLLELGTDSEDEEIFDTENEVHSDDEDVLAEGIQEPNNTQPEEYDPYEGLSPEEREIKEKEEYIWRFRILKKQYGNNASIPIPMFNEHSDLPMMKTSYERTIRELYLDDSVETYRTYLLGGWIVIEYACTQWIGIDLRGFTMQQTKMMYKYDRMLIELGEKSYSRWGMNLPVEVRLLFMILFQAGIFYLGKIITEKFGDSVAELFKGFTGQPPGISSTGPATSTPKPGENEVNDDTPKKKKMRGPNIKASDIRKRTSGLEE